MRKSAVVLTILIALLTVTLHASITDDFERGDGGLGGNWTAISGSSALVIESGKVRAGAATDLEIVRYTGSSFVNDQTASITLSGADNYFLVCARLQSGTFSGYCAEGGVGGSIFFIRVCTAGSCSDLESLTLGSAVQVGDIVKVQVTGTTVSAYINGSQVGSNHTDSTYSSGNPGFGFYDSSGPRNQRIDLFLATGETGGATPTPKQMLLGVGE